MEEQLVQWQLQAECNSRHWNLAGMPGLALHFLKKELWDRKIQKRVKFVYALSARSLPFL